MQTGIRHLHSGFAYLVLLALIVAIGYFLVKFLGKKQLTGKDKKFGLIAMVLTHIQLLFGLVLYFIEGRYKNFGDAMSEPASRLLAIEHPLMNIIAVVLITIGYRKVKNKIAANGTAGVAEFAFFLVGLLLILSRIPWSSWGA